MGIPLIRRLSLRNRGHSTSSHHVGGAGDGVDPTDADGATAGVGVLAVLSLVLDLANKRGRAKSKCQPQSPGHPVGHEFDHQGGDPSQIGQSLSGHTSLSSAPAAPAATAAAGAPASFPNCDSGGQDGVGPVSVHETGAETKPEAETDADTEAEDAGADESDFLPSQRHRQPRRRVLPPLRPCPRYDTGPVQMQRKIWVKRPGASPTRVEVAEDDLVDNVRDVVLAKYANSLGRTVDSPDIALKIISRDQSNKALVNERLLGPEEPIGRTLDTYYPGGQTVDEALIIEVPQRRTPRPSPRTGNHHIAYYLPESYRPDDAAREYFPPMPLHSPHGSLVAHPNGHSSVHSMAVLTTGQLPPLPSPGGGHGARRYARPKYGRQHTSSPTIVHNQAPNGGLIGMYGSLGTTSLSEVEPKSQINGAPVAPSLPTPPVPVANEHKPSITPPNRTSSPRPGQRARKRKNLSAARSTNGDLPPPPKPASAALLDGTVPPINVLLVEDNVINLKLLEAFMKRLKVRWKSAMNGKEAVAVWRTGGFHLVLMDIQLPVMNGLEATKEIRRLEAVNGIGVFSGSPIDGGQKMAQRHCDGAGQADDRLDRSLFKSPVIIVALTASSLQSDRHEALAAGCNDFLTKVSMSFPEIFDHTDAVSRSTLCGWNGR